MGSCCCDCCCVGDVMYVIVIVAVNLYGVALVVFDCDCGVVGGCVCVLM